MARSVHSRAARGPRTSSPILYRAEPEIVLADEPTANLDSKTAESLLDLMAEMNEKRGATFLFSTHDPRVMSRARRIIRLSDGRIEGEERRDPR